MADGPTIVNSGGNGAAWAIAILAIVALVALLFFTGVIDLGGGGTEVNIQAPSAPSAPVSPGQ